MKSIIPMLFLFAAVLSLSFAGCSSQDGPVRYTLSGTITMPDGKPVPAGEINFEPDGQAGNKGPPRWLRFGKANTLCQRTKG